MDRIPGWHLVITALAMSSLAGIAAAQQPKLMPLGEAWAANSVNAVVFRGDPITTHEQQQYAAYYDADGRVVIASRQIGQVDWQRTVTQLQGNVKDAHDDISIIADSRGYLHVSWGHHGDPLRYTRSKQPGVLEFREQLPMTGQTEGNVTYPQFFRLADGNLLFLYRDGSSGSGNLVVNQYDAATQTWIQLHDNLISGEGKRNAYWQATADVRGSIHLSWVWRESPDVASNHDICYARSDDGGKTWVKSTGEAYKLPITAATAEVAAAVPQKHELINQTSMCTDGEGRPMIATYFRPADEKVVQYMLIRHDGHGWGQEQVSPRRTAFSLSGAGSKQIPISRPQVVAWSKGGHTGAAMIFRDTERESRASIAVCKDLGSAGKSRWTVTDLTPFSVRYWEPSFDRVRWERDGVLDLYVQAVGQGDGEALENVPPQTAYVLEWKPDGD
jgi:hypothetical protein